MLEKTTQGIEGILKSKGHLEVNDIIRIHYILMKEYPLPKVSILNKQDCKPESRLLLKIEGYPPPTLNVFKGRLEQPKDFMLEFPIYASFRTTKNARIVPISNMEKNCYSAKIPKNVLNGLLGIILPVEEFFGPPKIINKYPKNVKIWIKKSNHISAKGALKEYCPAPMKPSANIRYLATIVPDPFNFHFGNSSPSCSLCPWGAIKMMGTYCYVDPDLCRGQKYSISVVAENGERREHTCWHCFNTGDNTISSKCDYITLRKVLHINPHAPRKEVPCCGKTDESPSCDLFISCTRGAVKKDLSHGFWYVDKTLCNGCAECYYAFSCSWNCGIYCEDDCEQVEVCENFPLPNGQGGYYHRNIRPNYTIRMVAQIDNRQIFTPVIIFIGWATQPAAPIPWESPWNEYENFNKFELGIWADKKYTIPIDLGKKGIHEFKLIEIPFTRRIHLGLFQDGKLFGYQFCGSNLPIRSIGGKRYNDITKLTQGGSLLFYSPIGKLQLGYRIEKSRGNYNKKKE